MKSYPYRLTQFYSLEKIERKKTKCDMLSKLDQHIVSITSTL